MWYTIDMKTMLAKYKDPKVTGGKIGHVFTPGSISGVCAGTGVDVTYEPDNLYKVAEVAVDMAAAKLAGWFAKPKAENPAPPIDIDDIEIPDECPPPVPTKIVKPQKCPKCGGLRRGRGFTHETNCPLKVEVKTVPKADLPVCPSCGGTKRGRGFAHAPGCKNSCKSIV